MRNALLIYLWAALGVSACKLDTQGGKSGAAPACADGATACDGGTMTSSDTQADAAATGTKTGPAVMTGQTNVSDASTSSGAGGMSSANDSDAAVAPPRKKNADGDACSANIDCASGHCLHDICCAGGDCCRTAADCPKTIIDGLQVACNDPSTCQGKRGEVRCENNLCIADGDVADDSACTSQIVKDCTPYKAATCNGMAEQTEPPCQTSCASDDDCVEAAHCDSTSKTCQLDVDDGNDCRENHDCVSDHCSNRVCCKSGDCCHDATGCFLFGSLPMCVDLDSCMGSMKVATCKANQCGSDERPSNAACNGMTVQTCGLYPDVRCDNGTRAPCATSCRVDSQCKAEAYCKQTASGGTCEPKLKDGDACTSTSQCRTACNHGFCCGDTNPDTYCCGSSDDCRALAKSDCVSDPNSCDGTTSTATCSSEHRCTIQSRPDPNACTNRSIDCGVAYKARAMCPLGCGCGADLDCSAGYICSRATGASRGTCQKDPNAGMGMTGGGPGMGGMGGMP